MKHAAQARAIAELRAQITKSLAALQAIERMLDDMTGRAPATQLGPLIERIGAAKKDAAAINAMFGPLDPDVVPLRLFQRGCASGPEG